MAFSRRPISLLDRLDRRTRPAGRTPTGERGRAVFRLRARGTCATPAQGHVVWAGCPGYRAAGAVLGPAARETRDAWIADPQATATAIVERHLTAYGPSSRQDIAWWSGLGLTAVNGAIARLADRLTDATGPDGRIYWSLVGDVPGPASIPETALLPEFDALLCGFDPPARARFVDPAHYDILWKQQNGQLLAPVLDQGRLAGYWRIGGTSKRVLTVTAFSGARRPTKAHLAEPIAALEAAMDLHIASVEVTRHP
ncbi:DNA glycosylase AlkZ-like family protein [Nostocoides veronense]|uniref:DNA glycosylase AlkZ-like family protein n=1 Tax=Nostocoides veronense TaxID=330836 RepID=UPI0031DD5117